MHKGLIVLEGGGGLYNTKKDEKYITLKLDEHFPNSEPMFLSP